MKRVTRVSVYNDSSGHRMSVVYSEIDEETHRIVKSNICENYVVTEEDEVSVLDSVVELAESYLNTDNEADLAEAGRILLGE